MSKENVSSTLSALRAKASRGQYMSKDEELWLGKLMFEGHPWDYPRDTDGDVYANVSEFEPRTPEQLKHAVAAAEILYESNKKLVYKRANIYFSHYHEHVPIDECVMNGFQGLARALRKYDYRKGFKFSSYAIWWIYRDIHRESNAMARIVDIPAVDIKRFTDVNKDVSTGIPMETALVNQRLTRSTYDSIASADDFYTSIDTKISSDNDTVLSEVLSSDNMETTSEEEAQPNEILEREMCARDLALCVAALPEKQRTLISLIFNASNRPVSDASARRTMKLGKQEYDRLKKDALSRLASGMKEWSR